MDERRAFPRVRGPFDGIRRATLDLDIRIYDLSAGGCFVESMVDASVGETVRLAIDLPGVGLVEVVGRVVPTTRSLGYAVEFVTFTGDAQERVRQAVEQMASSR